MCSVEKHGSIYILTLIGDEEHRLNPNLITAVRSSLNRIKSKTATSKCPTALILTAQGKFFSNGYDLSWAFSSGPTASQQQRLQLMSSQFRSLVIDLISLPMPTIAAVTGHASAAGCILALCHDYLFMRKDRGFLYMSELDIGLKLPAWIIALIRCKIGRPMDRREMVLKAAKLTAEKAVEMGVVDLACDGAAETVRAAVRFGEELVRIGCDGHVYGEIRVGLCKEVLDTIEFEETVDEEPPLKARLFYGRCCYLQGVASH
ncbi:hypothetical protein Ancab_023411 [Ancistrocladus abbreviatus]